MPAEHAGKVADMTSARKRPVQDVRAEVVTPLRSAILRAQPLPPSRTPELQ